MAFALVSHATMAAQTLPREARTPWDCAGSFCGKNENILTEIWTLPIMYSPISLEALDPSVAAPATRRAPCLSYSSDESSTCSSRRAPSPPVRVRKL